MNSQAKLNETSKSTAVFLRFSIGFIFIILGLLFFFQSCAQSNAGGTTGGNPLDSSLPQQISADVQ